MMQTEIKKPLWRRITASVLFLVCTAVMFLYLYNVLSWKDTNGDYLSTTDTLYRLEDNTVDVLFMGSSHCYCAVDTAALWEDAHMASFSMTVSGQDPASTYYCLKEVLKTQKPKVLFLEMYTLTHTRHFFISNFYRNALALRPSRNAVESALAQNKEYVTDSDILLRWPIWHTRYRELTRRDFESIPAVYMGYECNFVVRPLGYELNLYEEDGMIPIPAENESYFRQTIELAQANGMEVCLFLSPMAASDADQCMYAYASDLAMREYGVPTINFIALSEELDIDTDQDFCDDTHLNDFGAAKVTAYLAEYIREHYDIPARESSPAYALWDANVTARAHERLNDELDGQDDIYMYMETLGDMRAAGGYTMVICATGAWWNEEYALDEILEPVLSEEEFGIRSGVWVLEDDQVTFLGCATHEATAIDLGWNDLSITPDGTFDSIALMGEEQGKVQNGVNVFVYDRLFQRKVDAAGFYAENWYEVTR